MMKNKVLLLLFVGLLMGLVIYSLHPFSKGKPVKKPPAVREQKEEVKFETLKRKSLGEGWGRNPFFRAEEKASLPSEKVPSPIKEAKALPSPPPPPPSPPLTPPPGEQGPPLKLEMIFMVDTKKVAILSGQFVKEGDKVGGEVVARINSDRVILQKNKSRRTIKLDPFSIPFQVEKRRP